MNCELLATCSALGYLEGDTYHKETDCLGECGSQVVKIFICYKESVIYFCIESSQSSTMSCLRIAESVKDLIRYLRHEDDTRDVRQQLGAGQIVQNDLLPIIIQHGQDKALFDASVR